MLIDLNERVVGETLLFITDVLHGIDEELKQIYQRTDFQLCTVHAS
ncbi:transposase [Caldiplasma sukawensis]